MNKKDLQTGNGGGAGEVFERAKAGFPTANFVLEPPS